MDYTADQILEWAKRPDDINDPQICDELLFWASSWKIDFENELATVDHQVSQKLVSLIEIYKSRSKAEAYLALEDIYKHQRELELRIVQLKEFRANVKRRYEILTEKLLQKRYGR